VAYLPGVDMEALLFREPRPPLGFAAYVGLKAALALAHVHALAVGGTPLLHRAVSARHLRATFRGECVLLGLAPPLEPDPAYDGPLLMLPSRAEAAFFSPEQITGRTMTAQSDLYSLGAVLWEAVTGRRLVETEGPLPQLLMKALEPAPDVRALRPETPEDLAELIAALLQREPGRRPATAAEVHARLAPHARLRDAPFGPLQVIEVLRTQFPSEHSVEMGRAS
jgi:serine/threonine protein kinase